MTSKFLKCSGKHENGTFSFGVFGEENGFLLSRINQYNWEVYLDGAKNIIFDENSPTIESDPDRPGRLRWHPPNKQRISDVDDYY